MKVDYLFSRNKKIGSKLISWASRYEKTDLAVLPSHIAVLLDDSIVVESTLTTGVRMVPYNHWKCINEELFKLPCKEKRHSHATLEQVTTVWGKKYDWLGIAYFGYCYLRLILLGETLPGENKWQNKDKYFCTEYIGKLTGENLSMCSPAKICNKWLTEG